MRMGVQSSLAHHHGGQQLVQENGRTSQKQREEMGREEGDRAEKDKGGKGRGLTAFEALVESSCLLFRRLC